MATIQSIDSKDSLPPIRVTQQGGNQSMFYRLDEDVPASSDLAVLDFQVGDSVQVDSQITPTDEDVLMFQRNDGTFVLLSLQESTAALSMTYVGVVLLHLRQWTKRRRLQSNHAQQQRKSCSTILGSLAKRTSFDRLTLLNAPVRRSMDPPVHIESEQTSPVRIVNRNRCSLVPVRLVLT